MEKQKFEVMNEEQKKAFALKHKEDLIGLQNSIGKFDFYNRAIHGELFDAYHSTSEYAALIRADAEKSYVARNKVGFYVCHKIAWLNTMAKVEVGATILTRFYDYGSVGYNQKDVSVMEQMIDEFYSVYSL